MRQRVARQGPRAGGTFWGCSRYPVCKGLVSISSPPAKRLTSEEYEHRVIRYYISCIEAEGRRELLLPEKEQNTKYVVLEKGQESFFTSSEGEWRNLASSANLAKFAQRHAMGTNAERMFYGYPLVVGSREDERVIAPLFYAPIESRASGTDPEFRPEGSRIELSLVALELLGYDRHERNVIAELLDFPDDDSFAGRMEVIQNLDLLPEKWGKDNKLKPMNWKADGLAKSALVFSGERAIVTRQLLADLEELHSVPIAQLRSSPAGLLINQAVSPVIWPDAVPQPGVLATNFSQDRAITAAMECNVTVVTGPPGTGKSQVLVNTVASALEADQSVLFASKNNQAVDVVFQRLSEVSPEVVPLRAGTRARRAEVGQIMLNALNKKKAVKATKTVPSLAWAEIAGGLRDLYEAQADKADLESQLIEVQQKFDESRREVPASLVGLSDSRNLIRLLQNLDDALKAAEAPTGITEALLPWVKKRRTEEREAETARAWNAFTTSLPAEFARHLPADAAAGFRTARPIVKKAVALAKLQEEQQQLAEDLSLIPDQEASAETLQKSEPKRLKAGRDLFGWNWAARQQRAGVETRSKVSAFANGLAGTASSTRGPGAAAMNASIGEVIKMFPVWGVTNLSARTNLPLQHGLFDLLIVDEASQCDVASALPLAYRAKRMMVIGDRHQLIHVSNLRESQDQELARSVGLTGDQYLNLGYRSVSLFDLAARLVGERQLLLEEHYRSREAIIRFSNDLFYGSRLIIRTKGEEDPRDPALVWQEVQGKVSRGKSGKSYVNLDEASAVVARVQKLKKDPAFADASFGVVTPFSAQVALIRDKLANADASVTVATAHRFQGDERDVMVFSPVISTGLPPHTAAFVNNGNLVNVALTRARQKLVIVGNRQAALKAGGVLGQLAQYAADLEAKEFASPLERALFHALDAAGIDANPGKSVKGHRLDLAIEVDGVRLDVECDGAAFHKDVRRDAIRDAELQRAGWKVLRISGRDIINHLDVCVARVQHALSGPDGGGQE